MKSSSLWISGEQGESIGLGVSVKAGMGVAVPDAGLPGQRRVIWGIGAEERPCIRLSALLGLLESNPSLYGDCESSASEVSFRED